MISIQEILKGIKPYVLGWMERFQEEHWVYPNSPGWVGTQGQPLTSTNFDGDETFSTTAKTKIDLSTEFKVPAGVRAVKVLLAAKDAGSSAGTNICVLLAPNNTANYGPLWTRLDGIPNSHYHSESGEVSCDENGDVYYQTSASGSGTMYITMQIWGYER